MPQTIQKPQESSKQPQRQYPEELHPAKDFVCYMKEYARQKPDVAALWCFGIGFVLGWKVKPW